MSLSRATPDDLLGRWHALHAAVSRELEPDLPPAPLQEALATFTDERFATTGWLALENDDVMGYAIVSCTLLDNPHLALLEGGVVPGWRHRGIATALLRRAAERAAAAACS